MKSYLQGMTLVEVIAASVITSLIAGGTLMALTTAVHLAKRSSAGVQVSHLAQQTLEKFRNHVACDDDEWYDTGTCAPKTLTSRSDSFVPPGSKPSYVTSREYKVTPVDLDGDGVNESSEVRVTVSWTPPQ